MEKEGALVERRREDVIGLPEILVKTMEPVASALIGINEKLAKLAQVVDKFGELLPETEAHAPDEGV
jgi:hypothetical protein